MLSESLEDYLETILKIEKIHKVARAKDIAKQMGVKRASVTGALKLLKEKNLIDYEPYAFVTLKPKGKKIAKDIEKKHRILKDFFTNILRLDEELADNVACKMEHATDKIFIDRMVDFIAFINKCPKAGSDWLDSFIEYCDSNKNFEKKRCENCLEKNMNKILLSE